MTGTRIDEGIARGRLSRPGMPSARQLKNDSLEFFSSE